jgi:PII-like signaling protein
VVHTSKIEVLSVDLPVKVEFVETAQRIDELLPTLYDMVSDGLIEVHDTTVVKAAMKERKPEPKHPHERRAGKAKLLRVFLGEADRWNGEPLHDAIVKKLHMMDIAGATVYRGILGYGAKGHTHKQSFWHVARDLPVMIAVVDEEPKLREAVDAIEAMIEDGLIVMSDVDVIRLVHSHTLAEAGDAGVPKS